MTAVPVQAPPAWQVSSVVHRELSVHVPPVAITVTEVVPGLEAQPLTVTETL
jgi:hypothetical protein